MAHGAEDIWTGEQAGVRGLLLLGMLAVAPPVMAGMIGNPIVTAEKGTFLHGAEFDFTSREVNSSQAQFSGRVNSQSLLLRDSLVVRNKTAVYTRFGVVKADTGSRAVEGDPGMAAGLGLKRTLRPYKRGLLGVGAQFLLYSSHDVTRGRSIQWREYEVWAGGTLEGVERFVPYGGIFFGGLLFSHATGRADPDATLIEVRPFGLFLGAEVRPRSRWIIQSEFRIIHENSLSFAVAYRF